MIPGIDLLGVALQVIGKQSITYYRNTGRTLGASGKYVASFGQGCCLEGSFQPVPRSRYQMFGLDFQKNYATFFASIDAMDLVRDAAGDQLTYCGKRYQVESTTPWFSQDGWKSILCVEIANVEG